MQLLVFFLGFWFAANLIYYGAPVQDTGPIKTRAVLRLGVALYLICTVVYCVAIALHMQEVVDWCKWLRAVARGNFLIFELGFFIGGIGCFWHAFSAESTSESQRESSS